MVRQKQSAKHGRGQKQNRGYHFSGDKYNVEARVKFPKQMMCKLCGYVFGDVSGGRWRLNCPRCRCCLYIDLWRDGWCMLDRSSFLYRFKSEHNSCVSYLVHAGCSSVEIEGEVRKWKCVDKNHPLKESMDGKNKKKEVLTK